MAELTELDREAAILKLRADIQQQYAQQARSRAAMVGHKKSIAQEEKNIAASSAAVIKLQHDLDLYIQAHGDPTAGKE